MSITRFYLIPFVFTCIISFGCESPSQLQETNYQIGQLNGKYFFINPTGEYIFPIGMNHLNIHELQDARDDMKHLEKGDLHRVLYDSLIKWGFNSSGYDRVEGLNSRFDLYHYDKKEILSIASYHEDRKYVDVFDSATVKSFEQMIAPLSRYNNDLNVIGLMYSDIPLYIPKPGRNWVEFFRMLPVESPGGKVYRSFLKEQYQDRMDEFNRIYGEDITQINEISRVTFEDVDPADSLMLADDAKFMSIIYRQYMKTIHDLHRKYAPRLLFLGDVFNKDDWTDDMIRIAGEYVDAIALQPSKEVVFDKANFEKVFELSGKPIVVSDHKVSFKEEGYDNIQGLEVPTQQEAAKAYEDYLMACFESPYVIGFNRCMFKSKFRPGGVLKQGLIDYEGNPHDLIIASVTQTNEKINQRMGELNGK